MSVENKFKIIFTFQKNVNTKFQILFTTVTQAVTSVILTFVYSRSITHGIVRKLARKELKNRYNITVNIFNY
jgi:hypothetical protein